MDILFWRPSKRRRRNLLYDSDSDDFMDLFEDCEDDMDQDSEMSRSHTPRSRVSTPELQLSSKPQGVSSLVDSAAKIVAKHVSCAELESHDPPVDEVLLKKIAFWAFPQDESHVKVFSQLTLQTPYEWNSGERRFTDGMIKKIRQVGFMVSAFVETLREKQESKVSLTFEKQHLTSTSCSTCTDVVFCQHIIAVILERIRHAEKVPVHAPVTETLSTLTRDQLQKLLQYAINEDPGGVLGRVFEHIDEIRDINSEVNQLAGAPDPTFGMFPDEKSTWEISLDKMKSKLLTDLGDGYNSYKDTCDLFLKSKTGFHDKYFKRVTDLINKNEVDSAGRILIAIAEITSNVVASTFRSSNSTRRVFLDVERMISCFIACFTGQIRQDVIKASLTINKAIDSGPGGPTYLVPKQWSEMTSIKLRSLDTDHLAVVNAMGGQTDKPFYEPLVASQLPETPEVLNKLFNKEEKQENDVYDEPLDVMMFRFESIIQYHQWTEDYHCRYKICVLGSIILRKLISLSKNYSILTYDERRTKMKEAMPETDKNQENQEPDISEPPPPKRARRSKGNTSKQKKTKDKPPVESFQSQIDEIQEDMRRSTEDGMFEGLNQAQLCYSMLYITYKMWQTLIVSDLDSSMQKTLFEATLRVFELSRFRYSVQMEVKEVSWWEQLMDKIQNYVQAFLSYDDFKELARRYSKALLQSKLSFYKDYLPLPLIDLLRNTDMPYTDQLQLASDVLCYSEKPIYMFNFLLTGHDYSTESEKVQLRNSVVKKYKTLLSQVFAVKTELPEQSEASRRVLGHLESVQDSEYVVAAYHCIKTNVENIVGKEDKMVLLNVLLNCIKECIRHNGQNGLFSHSTSVSDTLLFLSQSLTEEFLKQVLPLWTEMCQYFSKHQIKSILGVIKVAVKEIPTLIQDMSSIVNKYFTSPMKHERECCSLLKIFFPEETKRHQMLKKIGQHATHYTTDALLRIGKVEYKTLSKTNPSVEVFSKPVFDFLVLGLKPLKDKDSIGWSTASLHLNSKESKYLKWYFGKIAESLNKDLIKSEQFTKLMALLKEVLKKDVNLMLDFYKAMEMSVSGFKEIKSQLGKELVSCYLNKFHDELRNCNHTHYSKILDEMKTAIKECDNYVPNGAEEFGTTVVCFIRRIYKGKRKLIQLMDEIFPEYKKEKINKKDKK